MGHGQDDNAEQEDDDSESKSSDPKSSESKSGDPKNGDPKNEVNNEISGGQFDGPVGQFGTVYGDVNLNPPKSPEEAAFRARYMARMQDAWDAEERAKNEGPSGCAIAFVIVWIVCFGFIAFQIIRAISEHGLMP